MKILFLLVALFHCACWDDRGLPCREACDHLAACGAHLDIDCADGCARLVNYECETCVRIRTCSELANATPASPCPCALN